MARVTPFSPGRRWYVGEDREGRARFWWVIVGPGLNYADKPDPKYKLVRYETHPDDMKLRGNYHGEEQTFTTKHIKKYGKLEPV